MGGGAFGLLAGLFGGFFGFGAAVAEGEKGFDEFVVGGFDGASVGVGGGGDFEVELELLDFVFEFYDDTFSKAGADAGGLGESLGVLELDVLDGAVFAVGAEEREGDSGSATFDVAEDVEEAAFFGGGEAVEGVVGFADDVADVEIDGEADGSVGDEDGFGDVEFVADALAIDDDASRAGFNDLASEPGNHGREVTSCLLFMDFSCLGRGTI